MSSHLANRTGSKEPLAAPLSPAQRKAAGSKPGSRRLIAKRHVFASLLALSLSSLGFEDASAQPSWALDGAGCVPVDSAIQNNAYLIVAGRIKFRNTAVGSITVICPVSVKVGSVNSIGVSYRDSTGVGISAGVRASLRRIDKFSGAVTTVPGLNFSSDDNSETGYTWDSAFGRYQLDDLTYDHFVQVTLTRRSIDEIVEFGGVELDLAVE